jgi:hypothetical protein
MNIGGHTYVGQVRLHAAALSACLGALSSGGLSKVLAIHHPEGTELYGGKIGGPPVLRPSLSRFHHLLSWGLSLQSTLQKLFT